jgi:hypothetical protein
MKVSGNSRDVKMGKSATHPSDEISRKKLPAPTEKLVLKGPATATVVKKGPAASTEERNKRGPAASVEQRSKKGPPSAAEEHSRKGPATAGNKKGPSNASVGRSTKGSAAVMEERSSKGSTTAATEERSKKVPAAVAGVEVKKRSVSPVQERIKKEPAVVPALALREGARPEEVAELKECETTVVTIRQTLSNNLYKLSAQMSQLQKHTNELTSAEKYAAELRQVPCQLRLLFFFF